MQRKVLFHRKSNMPEEPGHFLDFGIESYESGTGWGHYTVALIEDLEGCVHGISIDEFRFVK